MFVIYEREEIGLPVRVWLEERKDLEESCQEQAYHLSQLPLLHKWACLMPDTHAGVGMPIGEVIVTDGMIIPSAVRVDVGRGMVYAEANVKVDDIREIMTGDGPLIQAMVGDIMRNVSVGLAHRKTEMPYYTMENAFNELEKYEEDVELSGRLEVGFYQIGTLGGGNHFIEPQTGDEGYLCMMTHSGSRHIGKSVYGYFHFKAGGLNRRWYSDIPNERRLAFLPVNTGEGKQYLNWMQLSMGSVKEDREEMMLATKSVLEKYIEKYTDLELKFSHGINCHHNYTASERHYDKDVQVYRRGAVKAGNGELAVIPEAMGSYSCVAMGKGNPESFCSSSHGAGRHYSRKGATAAFSCEGVMVGFQKQGVILGEKGKAGVAEESRFAYKDIQKVVNNQLDLVVPVKRLRTIGVIEEQGWMQVDRQSD